MHRPVVMGSAVLVIAMTTLFVSGCGTPAKKQAVQLTEQFTPKATDTYDVGITVTKDFKFEQPALKKLRQEETTTQVNMKFDQTIEKIDPEGWAAKAPAEWTLHGCCYQLLLPVLWRL